jgi:antitoxin VapB
MWDVVRSLVSYGSTVLLTTQYLEEADVLADEITVIDHGKKAMDHARGRGGRPAPPRIPGRLQRPRSLGRSQAVRLPKEFRLPGGRVRVRHVGDGVLLEPIASDVDAWFAELDRFADVSLFEDGRDQPLTPDGEDIFG